MRHSCTDPCIKKQRQHSGKRGYVNERLIMQDSWLEKINALKEQIQQRAQQGTCSHILPWGYTWHHQALSASRSWGVGTGTCLELAWLWGQWKSCSWDGAACLGCIFLENLVCSRKVILIEKEPKPLCSCETFWLEQPNRILFLGSAQPVLFWICCFGLCEIPTVQLQY